MKNILLIITLISFSSCTKLLVRANGYKCPRYESKGSVLNFASKNQIEENLILFADDTTSFKKTIRHFESTPGIIILNKNLQQLNFQNKNKNCSAPVERFLLALCNSNATFNYINDNSFLSLLSDLKVQQDHAIDYYIFLVWNKAMGRSLSKQKKWEELIRTNKSCNQKIYWVNSDLMASWYHLKVGKRVRYSLSRK